MWEKGFPTMAMPALAASPSSSKHASLGSQAVRRLGRSCSRSETDLLPEQKAGGFMLGQELPAYLSASLEYFIRFLSGESKD